MPKPCYHCPQLLLVFSSDSEPAMFCQVPKIWSTAQMMSSMILYACFVKGEFGGESQ